MRVVLDTNVLVSAVLGGTLQAIWDKWISGAFTLVVSDEILREYNDVLRRPKFGLAEDTVDDIISQLFHEAEFVTPAETLRVVTDDPDDDRFIAAAVEGGATTIVSGDTHLLTLAGYREIKNVSARQFIEMLTA